MGTGTSSSADGNNRLLSSDDLHGTDIFGATGDRIGEIDRLMVDRETGQVVYAVVRFSGFSDVAPGYPVPWRALRYSGERGGYVTKIDERTVRSAPALRDGTFGDRDWERSIFRHYGARPY